MGKYNVNFSCGHTEEIQLGGKLDDRYKKIAYFEENGLCYKCYKEKIKKEIEKKSEGLPILEGSEKQINWAMKIRLDAIKNIQLDIDLLIPNKYQELLKGEFDREGIDSFIDKIKSKVPVEYQEKFIELVIQYNKLLENINEVKTTTSSKWLIENQYKFF